MTAPETPERPPGASPAGRPAVIIPAHDEEAVIGPGLRTLLADAAPGEFDVVVVCNGCTDATAARAQAAAAEMGHDITVISIPVASKAAAIRAAEARVTGFPRVYVDADVLCPTASLRAMLAAIDSGAPIAVPTRVLDMSGASPIACAYYRGWEALPWVRARLAGRGAYALSRAVRSTFDEFPDAVADDRYVTTRVPAHEAVVVPEPVIVQPPGRMSAVLRVRRRVYAGNKQADAPTHDANRVERVRGLVSTVARTPSLGPALAVFAITTVLAKTFAISAARRGTVTWGRDDHRGGDGRPTEEPRPSPEQAADARADVDVVVVTYRSAGYVRESLRAIDRALEDIPGARIIVVDNGSDDDLVTAVRGVSERMQLVLRDVNDGFARGCHAGAELSDARRLLFVNPDAFIEDEAISALLTCADAHPGAGVLGGLCRTPDGHLDARSWFGRPTLWSAFCFAVGLSSAFPGASLVDPESADGWDGSARAVGVVSGGLMLVDRALWDALDGFDRTFFLYGEDADLCLRARAAGWSPRVCPEAVYRHRVGASSEGSNRLPLVMRGRVTTYRRNLRRPWGALAGELLVLGTGLRALAAGRRPTGGRPASGHRAWRDTWRRRDEWRRGWRPGDIMTDTQR